MSRSVGELVQNDRTTCLFGTGEGGPSTTDANIQDAARRGDGNATALRV